MGVASCALSIFSALICEYLVVASAGVLASFFPSAIEKMEALSVVAQRVLPMLTLDMPPLKVVGSRGVGCADDVCW